MLRWDMHGWMLSEVTIARHHDTPLKQMPFLEAPKSTKAPITLPGEGSRVGGHTVPRRRSQPNQIVILHPQLHRDSREYLNELYE